MHRTFKSLLSVKKITNGFVKYYSISVPVKDVYKHTGYRAPFSNEDLDHVLGMVSVKK